MNVYLYIRESNICVYICMNVYHIYMLNIHIYSISFWIYIYYIYIHIGSSKYKGTSSRYQIAEIAQGCNLSSFPFTSRLGFLQGTNKLLIHSPIAALRHPCRGPANTNIGNCSAWACVYKECAHRCRHRVHQASIQAFAMGRAGSAQGWEGQAYESIVWGTTLIITCQLNNLWTYRPEYDYVWGDFSRFVYIQ